MNGPCCPEALRILAPGGLALPQARDAAPTLDGLKNAVVLKLAAFRFRSATNLPARAPRENRFLDLPDDLLIAPKGPD